MPKLPSDGNFSREIHVAYTELFSWQNCFADVFLIYFSVESVDCAIPPCSICRLLACRSVEQPGCCHTWHGVFVLFLCTWFLLCSRWGQVPLAEFCFFGLHSALFCLHCAQYVSDSLANEADNTEKLYQQNLISIVTHHVESFQSNQMDLKFQVFIRTQCKCSKTYHSEEN